MEAQMRPGKFILSCSKRNSLVLVTLTAVCISCTSFEKSLESKHGESSKAAALVEGLSPLMPLLGSWSGEGQFHMAQGLKTPIVTSSVRIEPVLAGRAIMILSSDISIVFFSSKTGELRLASYTGSRLALGEEPETDAIESPLSMMKSGLTWMIHETKNAVIKDNIIVSEAIDRHDRYTFKLKDSGELSQVIESSYDGIKWERFFEATLKRAN
jgi:hypothetical protein